jgi:hypothetical protein
MVPTPKVLQRYGAPHKFDQFPQGTLCRVTVGLDGDFEMYKQVSPDEEKPIWELQDAKNSASVIAACEE